MTRMKQETLVTDQGKMKGSCSCKLILILLAAEKESLIGKEGVLNLSLVLAEVVEERRLLAVAELWLKFMTGIEASVSPANFSLEHLQTILLSVRILPFGYSSFVDSSLGKPHA